MDRRKLVESFIYSSEKHQRLIETLLFRCAEDNNTSFSKCIEDALIDYLVVRYPGSYPADTLLELREADRKNSQ